jgi:hypothetical protein
MILGSHGLIASQIASFDADAVAFFARVTAAGGTLSATEKTATNQLVLDLKANSLWTPMKAIYPMVGASAAACAQNLKSSSFTGTFTSTGWTFASTGVTGNGTSAYMNTGLVPNGNLSQNSTHISYYSRTNIAVSGQIEMGVDLPNGLYLTLKYAAGIYHANNSNERTTNMTNYTDSRGFFINNRVLSTEMALFRNNIKQTDNGLNSTGLSSQNIIISGYNSGGVYNSFSAKETAFNSIGDGLTDTQASNFYTAVQAFQTTLSRQV